VTRIQAGVPRGVVTRSSGVPGGRSARRRPRPAALPLVVALILLLTLVAVQAVGAALALAGLTPLIAGAVLLGSLLGSGVDLPVVRIATGRTEVRYRQVRVYGLRYVFPVGIPERTTIAVNLGGAVIPTALSAYLTARTGLWVDALLATAAVAVVVHLAAFLWALPHRRDARDPDLQP
jgi:uncharacterized membrane protein